MCFYFPPMRVMYSYKWHEFFNHSFRVCWCFFFLTISSIFLSIIIFIINSFFCGSKKEKKIFPYHICQFALEFFFLVANKPNHQFIPGNFSNYGWLNIGVFFILVFCFVYFCLFALNLRNNSSLIN